jgi:CSLREA domain-containing protein
MNLSAPVRCLLVALLFLPSSVFAALISVNTLDDENNNDGDCSLREAIAAANTNQGADGCPAGDSGSDTIFIAISGTINVSSTIQIVEELVILGPGTDALTISGQNSTSLFIVNMPDASHDFQVSLLTVADGRESIPGAAFWLQQGGTFRFENVHFRDNEVTSSNQSGGAIALQLPTGNSNPSALELVRCDFVNNTAGNNGGAVAVNGNPTFGTVDSLIIDESEFIGNAAGAEGGAIYAFDVLTMTVDRSRFHDNRTTGDGASQNPPSGGAIARTNYASRTSEITWITNSTFTSNRSDAAGGALRSSSSTTLIENSTFFDNRASGGVGEAVHVRGDTTAGIFHSTFVENIVAAQTNSGAISAVALGGVVEKRCFRSRMQDHFWLERQHLLAGLQHRRQWHLHGARR